jgi:hypothetical protein
MRSNGDNVSFKCGDARRFSRNLLRAFVNSDLEVFQLSGGEYCFAIGHPCRLVNNNYNISLWRLRNASGSHQFQVAESMIVNTAKIDVFTGGFEACHI